MQIILEHVSVILNSQKLLADINLTMYPNENWAIVGNSGSGKTTLAKAIAKQIFHHGEIKIISSNPNDSKIAFVPQQHQFKNKQNIHLFYHQQRFNSFDTEDTLTVAEMLDYKIDNTEHKWISFFEIAPLLNKPMIQLSNGENKRLQLTKTLQENPDLIILDNPFIGLDKSGRILLQNALNQLAQLGKKIIVICNPNDIPSCVTHIACLSKGMLTISGPKEITYEKLGHLSTSEFSLNKSSINKLYQPIHNDFEKAVELKNVNITYKEKVVLENINWIINKGEKWCVSGPNGSGKSTLLSLITADNPQAFANKIWLFDKKKGSGESIWDIKKKIGHVSPELHLFFEKGIEVKEAVASGLFDTIGLFKQISNAEEIVVESWMEVTGINHFKSKRLHQLSLGEQRLVMLTRALVKSPPLLILDEPCQGLDEDQAQLFKEIIDEICLQQNITLIYVSHYNDDIPKSINHFLHLENGQIKQ
jgi:molybdate transport system ATP-binding protein